MSDPLLTRLLPLLAAVEGVAAIVLGGSRARGTATDRSDYDLGLYYCRDAAINADSLRREIERIADAPPAVVTSVGEWGPWIVGGAWLSVGGRKVDLLYRGLESVAEVIEECRAGRVRLDYQPGHPHVFCSAIWMGEVALCHPLCDPDGRIALLKALTNPYPHALRGALAQRFFWEVLFSIENAELAAARGEQTHFAGCVYRALSCIAQCLFALNRRYCINEKGALIEAAGFPVTLPDLAESVALVWQAVGRSAFSEASEALRRMDDGLRSLVKAQRLL
jgi:Nucleotidyltransferase domain